MKPPREITTMINVNVLTSNLDRLSQGADYYFVRKGAVLYYIKY